MRRFAYSLIRSIYLFHHIKPKVTIKSAAIDCPGCCEIVYGNARTVVPRNCPVCGRPVNEIARETYFIAHKRRA